LTVDLVGDAQPDLLETERMSSCLSMMLVTL